MANSIVDLKKFFSTAEHPVSMEEFKAFWDTLSEQEKEEFKAAKIK